MKSIIKKCLSTAACLLAGASFVASSPAQAATDVVGFGMVAYWGEIASTYGGQIPNGAYVVINPNSGALGLNESQITNYKAVIANIRNQGGRVLGYVATGYDRNTAEEQDRYAAISDNILAYSNTLGGVDGYFFDEAAHDDASLSDQQKCAGTSPKWTAIRSTLNSAGEINAVKVWNAGWPGMNACFVSAAQYDEHVIMYEASYSDYANAASWLNGPVQNLANSLGVKTWLLIHSATQNQMQDVLKNTTAKYVYVTSMAYNPSLPWGGPIWNYTPSFWGNETTSGTERGCLQNLKNNTPC